MVARGGASSRPKIASQPPPDTSITAFPTTDPRLPRDDHPSQAIYMSNGGLTEAEEAATPVAYWKKVAAFFAISGLVLFPAFFLLMFGVAQGKPAVKAWFIDAMMIVNLEVLTVGERGILLFHYLSSRESDIALSRVACGETTRASPKERSHS